MAANEETCWKVSRTSCNAVSPIRRLIGRDPGPPAETDLETWLAAELVRRFFLVMGLQLLWLFYVVLRGVVICWGLDTWKGAGEWKI